MIVVNLMKNSSHIAVMCQFIKNTYVFWCTEIYKRLADINADFKKPYLIIKETPYNLRNGCALQLLQIQTANSTYYRINLILFRACLLWNRLPLSSKSVTT